MVAGTIGSGVADIGSLFFLSLLNYWGFNSPDAVQQTHFWGNTNPQPWFELGAFRRYDHYWRSYSLDSPEIGGDLNNYGAGFLGFNTKTLASLTEAPERGSVPHVFDIYMNRWDINWNLSYGAVLIAENFTIYEDGRQKIDIDPLSPPDGFGPLPYNHPIYFRLVRKSSPVRRWDSRAFTQGPPLGGSGSIIKDTDGNVDAWVISIEIGQPI